jgi:hypothetical protein
VDVYDDDDDDDDDDEVDDTSCASFGFIIPRDVRDGDDDGKSCHDAYVEERQVVRSTKEDDAIDAGDRGGKRR